MNNKGRSILMLVPAGILIFLLLVLNIVVIVQGRVSLHQRAEAETQETEMVDIEDQNHTDVTAQIENFHIERSSNVVGEAVEAQKETTGEYLCADSIARVLTEEDVANLKAGVYEGLPEGKDIIQMVVNEIYARNGYQFGNEEIQAYFASKSWYQVRAENAGDMDAIYKSMSDIDRANIDFLKEVR